MTFSLSISGHGPPGSPAREASAVQEAAEAARRVLQRAGLTVTNCTTWPQEG